ncbi:MAG: tRNA uridine-5-carboxymethylaminomethyl(34) synthesis GTPase MnmE [Methylovirgula sp.]
MTRLSDEVNRAASARDTIYALASGQGRAAIAVLRLSGTNVRNIVASLVGKQPVPRRAHLATFKDPQSGAPLDRGLVLFFPGPASFTGEDCAEFHIHGGTAVVAAMIAALADFEKTRPAEAGEFTRRAFENGKLDLTEVEGLADLVDAETEAQRRQALRQAEGGLRHKAEAWRAALLEASALLEAEIDFAEEADVAPLARKKLAGILVPVRADLEAALAAGRAGERLRDGLAVVIAGPPNAGKSTLLNALARREAAIVSPLPGTTRDAIEVHLDLAGVPVTLIDTAGLRAAREVVEQIGIDRARAKAKAADLVLWLSEAGAPAPHEFPSAASVWPILTKIDLQPVAAPPKGAIALSAATGENLDLLLHRLVDFARTAAGIGEPVLITRERHRKAFAAAAAALRRAEADIGGPVELLAEELRTAVRALEILIGRIDVENVLGEIFARFCIGK